MYRDAVEYKPGHYLAPGSEALELYKDKKFAELEKLLKETDAAWRKLEGRDGKARTVSPDPQGTATPE